MKYTKEHLERAKLKGLPLMKIEIDFRFAKDVGNGTRQQQCWGACDKETALKLRKIIREQN